MKFTPNCKSNQISQSLDLLLLSQLFKKAWEVSQVVKSCQ